MTSRDLVAVVESVAPLLSVDQRARAARFLAGLAAENPHAADDARRRRQAERLFEEEQLAGNPIALSKARREPA